MSTYDGAYRSLKASNYRGVSKREKEQYHVIRGSFIDSHHYHGSWFEYTWLLELECDNGEITTKKLDTWEYFSELNGQKIEYDGTVFTVIK